MSRTNVLVCGDIHANRPALDAVLEDVGDVEAMFCTGDIVGILGWNAHCVDVVRDQFDTAVFGNHEARIRPEFAYAPSFPAARDEHELVTEQLDAGHVEYIASLPDRVETERYILAHARAFYRRDPGYPCHGFAQGDHGVPPREFTTVGPYLDGRIALLGHTHQQHAVDCTKFPGQSGTVLNPGSVGVPWDGEAEYAVVDLDTHEYELHSVEYDDDRVRERLLDLGLPPGKYDR